MSISVSITVIIVITITTIITRGWALRCRGSVGCGTQDPPERRAAHEANRASSRASNHTCRGTKGVPRKGA